MSDEPVIAQKGPFAVEVTAGRKYLWCACGRSKSGPFCDGSHKNTAFKPKLYEATTDGTVYFCGCKHTQSPPLCDDSHMDLD